MVSKLQASPSFGNNTLIIITFDEGDKDSTGSCCGLGNDRWWTGIHHAHFSPRQSWVLRLNALFAF